MNNYTIEDVSNMMLKYPGFYKKSINGMQQVIYKNEFLKINCVVAGETKRPGEHRYCFYLNLESSFGWIFGYTIYDIEHGEIFIMPEIVDLYCQHILKDVKCRELNFKKSSISEDFKNDSR